MFVSELAMPKCVQRFWQVFSNEDVENDRSSRQTSHDIEEIRKMWEDIKFSSAPKHRD